MTSEGCAVSEGGEYRASSLPEKQPQRTSARAVAAAVIFIVKRVFIAGRTLRSELNFNIIAESVVHLKYEHRVAVYIEI